MTKKGFRRYLAIISGTAMIITSLPFSTMAAGTDTADEVPQISESVNEEPYIISEITQKREEDAKYFLMSDGSFMAAKYSEPIHYLNEGVWEDIDNSFSASSDENNEEVFENNANSFSTKFAKKSKDKKLVSIKKDGYKIEWALQDAEKVNASVSAADGTPSGDLSALKNISGSIAYKDILKHSDLYYTVKSDRIKEDIVLKNDKAAKSYVFSYELKGLSYRITQAGSIEFFDPADSQVTVFTIERPYMYDAQKAYSDNVNMSVSETKKGIEITITPDEEWLMSEDRAWPVTIDPTILTSQKATDIWDIDMRNTQTSAFNYKAEDFLVGSNSGTVYRSVYLRQVKPRLPRA